MEPSGRRLQMDESQPPKKAGPLPPEGVHAITYCRLWNTGNYENQKLEVTAIVNEGEDPSEKFQSLRKWVDHELIHRPKQEKEQKWVDHELTHRPKQGKEQKRGRR